MKGELQLSSFVVQCILFFPISVGGLLLWSYIQANFPST